MEPSPRGKSMKPSCGRSHASHQRDRRRSLRQSGCPGVVVQGPFRVYVVRETPYCRRRGAITSCDREEGDDRQVTGSRSRVFPSRAIWTGRLMDSVRIQAGVMPPSFLFLGSQVGFLGGFIQDVGHGVVSAIAVSHARANSCGVTKLDKWDC